MRKQATELLSPEEELALSYLVTAAGLELRLGQVLAVGEALRWGLHRPEHREGVAAAEKVLRLLRKAATSAWRRTPCQLSGEREASVRWLLLKAEAEQSGQAFAMRLSNAIVWARDRPEFAEALGAASELLHALRMGQRVIFHGAEADAGGPVGRSVRGRLIAPPVAEPGELLAQADGSHEERFFDDHEGGDHDADQRS